MTHPPWTRRTAVVAMAFVAVATVGVARPAFAAPGSTIVSLTFDDGSQDQYDNGRPILLAHQMAGTFFINSARIGTTGYMSQVEVGQLATDGDEIAGHTIDHADLPTLATDDQKREVCNDRVALLNMGFAIKNFAYPYGDANATTQQIVADCGYNSARTVGGLVSSDGCQGCPYAESIPPADAYYTQTPSSVKTTTSLAALETYVTQAEQNGGGWVQLVMHHVCDSCDDVYAIRPATLSAFLDWLAARAPSGTHVSTVDAVIGGTVKPGVPGPPLPPPSSGNLVQNASLESANAGGVPTCFQLGGYGTNGYTYTRSTDAHTGSFAEQLTVTSYTNGDRKLVTKQDSGTCPPAVSTGHTYHVRAWYKGNWGPTAQVKVTLYYRDPNGAWVYWTSGPALSATNSWTQTPDFVSPPVPAGASAMSIGLALAGIGTLVTDDYSIIDTSQ